jgi:hypothetical protein
MEWHHMLETDQDRCYSAVGETVPCAGTGQDAAYAKHLRPQARWRFQKLGATVNDTLTSAIWSRNANPAKFPMTWHEALAYVETMRAQRVHGYGAWRLPTRRLLFSMISHQEKNPALPQGHPFEEVFNGYYWTSDTCRRLPDQAWYIHLGGGRIHRGMKHGSYLVWPVSYDAGERAASKVTGNDRFVENGACIKDRLTGLTWSKDADPVGRVLAWQEALSAIRGLNRGRWAGCDDWRLPNIRELDSLVDLDAHSPALPAMAPFFNVRSGYWSATTSVYEPRYAWALYLREGIVGVGYKPFENFCVWPVRSGKVEDGNGK